MPTLADFYERERRWPGRRRRLRAGAQRRPAQASTCSVRYASALLNAGETQRHRQGARRAARSADAARAPTSARCICCRRPSARPATTRPPKRPRAGSSRRTRRNPRGYYALAEALEERRQYQAVVDALAPAVAEVSGGAGVDSSFALSHAAAASRASRTSSSAQHDKAIARLRRSAQAGAGRSGGHRLSDSGADRGEEVRRGRRTAARGPRATARTTSAARAARGAGAAPERQADQGARAARRTWPATQRRSAGLHRAGAVYSTPTAAPQAVKVLQDAQAKFPADTAVTFELGAVLDKQKRYAEAEAAFRQVLARDPDHADALNYLGYMLAERGERLDESVDLVKRALADRARQRLVPRQPRLGVLQGRQARSRRGEPEARRRSADDQLRHPGSLRRRALQAGTLRRGDRRVDRALAGDGDSIDARRSTRRSDRPGRSSRRR